MVNPTRFACAAVVDEVSQCADSFGIGGERWLPNSAVRQVAQGSLRHVR